MSNPFGGQAPLFERLLNRDNLTCIHFHYQNDLPILYCTDHFYTLLEIKKSQTPLSLLAKIHPDDKERYVTELEDYTKHPEVEFFERMPFRVLTAQNTLKWISEKGIIERDEKNLVQDIAIYWQDITEQQTTSQNQIHEIQQFEMMMEALNIGYFEYNFLTQSVHYSNIWKKQLGYEPMEIEDQFSEWEKRVDPEYIEPSFAKLDDHLRGKSEWYEAVFPMRHKEGHKIWILAKGKIQKDNTGQALSLIATHTDLAVVKELPKQIAELAEFCLDADSVLQQAFMKSPIPMSIFNLNTHEFIANTTMIDLFQYHPSEVSGKLHTQIMHPDDRQENIEFIEQLIQQKIPDLTPVVRRMFHKDGYVCYIEYRSFIVTLENKDKILCSIARDVSNETRQKASEHALDCLLKEASTH